MFVRTPKFIQLLFPSAIWKKETSSKELWLTFDDGPEEIVTDFILDTLKKLNIKASFFLIGEQIVKFPELTKKILENGHFIGNHSFSHIHGYFNKNEKYIYDIEMGQKIINEKAVEMGIEKSNIFRPPFGRITSSQIKLLKHKYKIIMWDVFSWDFKKKISKKRLFNNVTKNISAGSIIVFHNNNKSYNNLVESLENILIELKKQGYSFSTTW